MHGIDIARLYYEEFGRAAIHEAFPEYEDLMAVGLAGSGSECYGFDDEISCDHDFEPGFCIWIPEENEIDSRCEFRMQRMYAGLPKDFMGLRRALVQPGGGNRHGVMRISEFLNNHIGRADTELTVADWFNIPESSLSELVNGQIWRDDSGKLSAVREKINNMPYDVRLKKLAGSIYITGQSGVYNYRRCIQHKEKAAAQLALAEFSKHIMHSFFLINGRYMPYYKWSFRAFRAMGNYSSVADALEFLLNSGNDAGNVENKIYLIDCCVSALIDELKKNDLISQNCNDLGRHADSVNSRIRDSYIRNTSILSGLSSSF